MSKPVVVTRRSQLQECVRDARKAGRTIGFVPTMGALHEGHAALVRRSAGENDLTVVSVFVNPKQFGPNEDFGRYPRTLPDDVELIGKAGGTLVFAPSVNEMYPEGFASSVQVDALSGVLCGQHRPGHFEGVCTVVLLLLNLAGADRAYFGLKDYQQLQIIRRMCNDLAHPTEIVPVPTVREADGLALSSRNRYLDGDARAKAAALPKALATTARLFLEGERRTEILAGAARKVLQEVGLEPQYLELRHAETLEDAPEIISGAAVLAVAQPMTVATGTCRLIDNVVLDEAPMYRSILEDLIRRANT